ncbi:putative splicing factor 3A subunit 1 [Cardamine amara subsp. amara]|uniref:Splicing factor 3A subunit 1 n=1 Tax=Cardamine amara subsp. amara TaxID=228776 RepID=A0ABD0ZM31_CARAN
MKPVEMKNWNQYPAPPDDNMKSIMLERLSIGGGLEMEEKLKTIYGGGGIRPCSSDPGHQRYNQVLDDLRASFSNGFEGSILASRRGAMSLGIPQGMMRKELDIIKFTVQFVVRYEFSFRKALLRNTRFKFLDESDKRCSFVRGLHRGYSHLIRHCGIHPSGMGAALQVFFTALKAKKHEDDGVLDKVETDSGDFVVVCDEYFAEIENKEPAFRVGIPQGGGMMMRKELGILKFTAQFVVRYGKEFWDGLWDRVSTETEFQFLKRNPANDTFFSKLVRAYGKVIRLWGLRPRKGNNPARMEALLKGFFSAFHAFKAKQEEERDEVVNKVVTDRRDFVVSDEFFQYFLDIEDHTPLPEPQSQKFDELALLSELKFLAQHPGPSTITISDSTPLPERLQMLHEPNIMTHPPPHKFDELAHVSEAQHPGPFTIRISDSTGRVIQITVQSSSEYVAGLKEKIAVETGILANQHKLRGRSGVLEDHMSLAHYNLREEEMLTLSY